MEKKAISTDIKAVPFLDVSTVQDTTAALSPVLVCMHVLTRAATDARVMRAATALVEAGYAVSVVDIEEGGNSKSEEDIRGVSMKHVMASRSFLSSRFDKWTLVRIVRLFVRSALRVMRTRADIYHAHDVSALPACYIAACLRHKPIIFEAHEMPLFERPLSEMGRSRRWLHKLLAILLVHILPRCAGIITVSPPIVEEIRKRYRVPEVTLIRSVPRYRTVPKGDRLRGYLGLKPGVRIALYQGYLQHNRGLDGLVRAAPFLEPNTVIVMMGQDTEGMRAELEAFIAREGVADRVKILPPVPYAELLDWTASADIGLTIFPPDYSLSIRFTLPNKLFEYLMAGRPVLSSQLDAIAEVIKTYDVGQIVPSLSPSDIGTAINAMLADAAALARMHSNALEVARRELHWENESQKLIQLYQAVLSKGGIH